MKENSLIPENSYSSTYPIIEESKTGEVETEELNDKLVIYKNIFKNQNYQKLSSDYGKRQSSFEQFNILSKK